MTETSKSLCLSTSDTIVPKGWRRNILDHTAPRTCTVNMCYGMVLQPSSQNWHTNGVWALWLLSFPSMCFFQCPQQAPKSQHSQGFKLKFVMIAYHVLPKKLHNSGNFPHWLQLCTRGLLRNSANSPNSMKFGEFAEWQTIRRIRRISCFIKRWEPMLYFRLWSMVHNCLLVGWPRAVHESCVWLQWGEAGRLKWLTTTEHKCDACTKAFRISHDLYKQVDNDCG